MPRKLSLYFPYFLAIPCLSVVFTEVLSQVENRRNDDPYHHLYLLDPASSYILQWTVDWSTREVVFNITAETRGYIGLGLATRNSMANSDLVIAGVYSTGEPYLFDMHGTHGVTDRNQALLDRSQDYQILGAWENSTHTSVSVSRPFNTCDEEEDQIIDDNHIYILWAVGESDDFQEYHEGRRGAFSAYLLDPDWTPGPIQEAEGMLRRPTQHELGDLQVWTLSRAQRVPAVETAYWCSVHKGPFLQSRHHLVGFNFRYDSPEAFQHTHHLLLFKCEAPSGVDPVEFFEPFVQNSTGEMCYFMWRGVTNGLPTPNCREVIYPYALGSRMYFFPEHAGMSIGNSPHEYYLLQVHYDNPQVRQDLEYTINIDLYYTPKLRENEAGLVTVGHHIPGSPSLLVPPNSANHTIYGHCGGTCTQEMLSRENIKVFAIQQHTHYSGVQHRFRHFRGNIELPWIFNDENYENLFQPTRMTRNEVTVMPGDHLMSECVYDNRWRNGSSVVGGLSTSQEMCMVYMWYYNKVDYALCRSEIVDSAYVRKWVGTELGNMTWSDDRLEYVTRDEGMSVSDILNEREWTEGERLELLRDQREFEHINTCDTFRDAHDSNIRIVRYPEEAVEWVPPDVSAGQCRSNSNNILGSFMRSGWDWGRY